MEEAGAAQRQKTRGLITMEEAGAVQRQKTRGLFTCKTER